MRFNRNNDEGWRSHRFEWSAFLQVHETMFCKILNVRHPLLKRGRPSFHHLSKPRWLPKLFSECEIAVQRIACQHKNRNRVGFVKPKQNRAFKLSDCGLV